MASYWERRREEQRRRELARRVGVSPSALSQTRGQAEARVAQPGADERAQERLRAEFPADPLFGESGTGRVRSFTPEEQAANRRALEGFVFGPERPSVVNVGQPASRPERFVRDWFLSEQEFRTAGERAREGELLPAAGWGALGLAGVVPIGGDAAQALARASRWEIPPGVDDLTRSTLEFQRAAGMSLDEALESVNRTRRSQGLEPISEAGEVVQEPVEEIVGGVSESLSRSWNFSGKRNRESGGASIVPDEQIPSESEEIFVRNVISERDRNNVARFVEQDADTWARISAVNNQSGSYLGDTPLGRAMRGRYAEQFNEVMQPSIRAQQIERATGATPEEAIEITLREVDPILDRVRTEIVQPVFSGETVVWRALSDDAPIRGEALKNAYIVPNRYDDLRDSRILKLDSGNPDVVSRETKQLTFLSDLAADIADDGFGAIVGFSRATDSGTTSFFTTGTFAESLEDAFMIAASRGQSFIRSGVDGSLIEVPPKYFERAGHPGVTGRNYIEFLRSEELDLLAEDVIPVRGQPDEVAGKIYESIGYDGPANVVSAERAVALVREGYIPVYRGITFPMGEGQVRGMAAFDESIGGRANLLIEAAKSDEFMALKDRVAPQVSFYDYVTSAAERWVDYLIDSRTVVTNSDRMLEIRLLKEIFPDAEAAIVNSKMSPEKWVEEFATGPYYPGQGSHGSGTYMTPNLQRAMGYAEIYEWQPTSAGNGVVVGALIDPKARIMGPNEYQSLVEALVSGTTDSPWWPHIQQAYMDDVRVITAEDIGAAMNFWGAPIPSTVTEVGDLRPAFEDIGRIITSLGYDGFIPHRSVYAYYKPEYVILNRTALTVVDRPIPPIKETSGDRLVTLRSGYSWEEFGNTP